MVNKNKDVYVNIMMLGGRRCGKTSVLASIEEQFDKEFGKTNLTIKAIEDTMFTLEEKRREADELYRKGTLNKTFKSDSNPTTEINEYKLAIELKNKPNGKIFMNLYDYPGEWLINPKKEKEHLGELNTLMKVCSVFIIAIDTPYLMEDDAPGDWNYCSLIGDLIKNNYSLRQNQSSMFLFIPLKCERYIKENKMDEVNKVIKRKYEKVFNHINNMHIEKKSEIAIIPIETLGNVEFARFENENALYKLMPIDGKKPRGPEPKNCDLPAVYILMYLLSLAYYSKSQKKAGFWSKLINSLLESFFDMPSANDFLIEVKNLKARLNNINSNNGYELICDPLKFKN